MIKIEIKTEEKNENGEQIGVFNPIVAAYVHESGGISAGGALQFRHPPSRPVLFAVTNDIHLRQKLRWATSYTLQLKPTQLAEWGI